MKKAILFFAGIFCLSAVSLAYALEWKQLHEEADKKDIKETQAALKNKPQSIDDMYVLGLVYLNLHKDKEAKDIFHKILALKPQVYEAKWGVAEVLRRQHNLKQSEEILEDLTKDYPEFSPAYISLAYLRYTQMDFNAAVRLASKVLQQGEKNVDLSNHVRAHLMLGGAKGMIAHYGGPISKVVNGTAVLPNLRNAEKLQPNCAAVKFGLGSFYLLSPALAGGDINKAEEYLTQAIEIDPLFADVYVRLGQLYKIKGDQEKYNLYLKKSLEIDPQNQLALDIQSGSCKFICLGKNK